MPVARTGRQARQLDRRSASVWIHRDPQHDPNQGTCNDSRTEHHWLPGIQQLVHAIFTSHQSTSSPKTKIAQKLPGDLEEK